ncbi:hypothetical protein J2I47_24785 [Fibrella sp. HMF5335]|uniref:Transmembrane protein n=1 Tax=Fibrella rubiginis TaxID=2817060 RepID=A0A939GLT8_9BACT|nr:hypothetical protein [Fibrella rubiginis]MBO0939785.1 hypothetical protein [Fibrella rubiginis]
MPTPTSTVSPPSSSLFTNQLARIHRLVDHWLQGDGWLWKVVLLGLLTPVVFLPTHSGLWNLPTEYWAAFQTKFYFWDTIEDQIIHPLRPIICYDENPGCHEDKMVFRLFLPALLALVRSRVAVYAVQLLCWPVFLYLLARETEQLTHSRSVALYLTLSVMGLYIGGAFPFDFIICGDAFAYFFLLVAAVNRNRFILLISLFLAYWVDERSLINSVYVLIYRCLVVADDQPLFGRQNVLTALTLLSSWVLYLSLRFGLGYLYHVETPTSSAGIAFVTTLPLLTHLLKLVRSYELLWALVAVGLWGLWQQRQILLLVSTLAALTVSMAVSIMVADTSRSMGYGLVLFLIVLTPALAQLRLPRLQHLLLITALFCVFFPTRYLLLYRPEIMYLFE